MRHKAEFAFVVARIFFIGNDIDRSGTQRLASLGGFRRDIRLRVDVLLKTFGGYVRNVT